MHSFDKIVNNLISLLLVMVAISVSNTAFTQKLNNIWIFGEHGGIDFNYNPPVGIKHTRVSTENGIDPLSAKNPYVNYTSSICDTSGKLLLYTDGISVWNSKHAKLLRYMSRWPWSDFCSPLIVPHRENDSLFYIFGVSSGGPFAKQFQYLNINVKSYDGNGRIVYPQPSTPYNYFTVLKDSCSVFVAGTAHCNRKDFWVVTHSQNTLYAYLVTENGVAANAVKSATPTNFSIPDYRNNNTYANIKFSASGEKLVMPLINTNQMIVFDFDNRSGKFSNPVTLNIPENLMLEDVELSPDGSKLYFGAYSYPPPDAEGGAELHNIYQMDLNAGTTGDIEHSITTITTFADAANCARSCFLIRRTLQLAPDGKIYASMKYFISPATAMMDVTASVITAPNEKGDNVNYTKYGLNIGSKYYYIAYNYFRSNSFTPKKNAIQFKRNSCSDVPISFSLIYNQIDSVEWNFGDAEAGENNFSTVKAPQHLYSKPGTYVVKAIIYSKCFTDSSSDTVNVMPVRKVQLPATITDQTVCKNFVFDVNAFTPYASKYLWSTGNDQPLQKITKADGYKVVASNSCSLDQKTFTVMYKACNCNVFVPNSFTPNKDGLNDRFKPIIDCNPLRYEFFVYDKFGQVQFRTSKIQEGWDGYIKAYPGQPGVYVWRTIYQNPNDKKVHQLRGTVTLIR